MPNPRYPSLYQINTRAWLSALSQSLRRRATLDDIPDRALDELAAQGFHWLWMLSVWQTGPTARSVSRSKPEWLQEFRHTLPDLTEDDIAGSGFAIASYTAHRDLGGDAALARLRERMRRRGLRLMLDFVPNHVAPDHPWVASNPEYFLTGTEADAQRAPQNYFRANTPRGPQVFAYGRDPYFDGWADTIQLNYGNPALQEAMVGELTRIAGQCDGVRCDMAMLLLPEVFRSTWGVEAQPFWPKAIAAIRQAKRDFVFMAEVYWDLEWTLQQQGFDYCYDKRLYDRLREGKARPVREHLLAGLDFQDRLARFLENHDEPRAAETFDFSRHRAAALITFLSPGLRFFHQGQLEGYRNRISPHLARGPVEQTDPAIASFYAQLLGILRRPTFRDGQWRLLECVPAWDGNASNENFVACSWEGAANERIVVAVNFSDRQGQAKVRLPFPPLPNNTVRFRDLLTNAAYDWPTDVVEREGLFVDLPAWGTHVLAVEMQG
jgi:glycosidase